MVPDIHHVSELTHGQEVTGYSKEVTRVLGRGKSREKEGERKTGNDRAGRH